MTLSVALETLGCKVNQYESSHLLETLREEGYRPVSFRDPADIYIVHGCAVTSRAAFQARQLLRRARRINPHAVIVAAGCHAQLEPERIAEERLATHILGNDSKFDLASWLKVPGSLLHPLRTAPGMHPAGTFRPLAVTRMHSERARAFLKLQDGCDAHCSYCIVPSLRGPSRSLPADEVRLQLDRFLDQGYREIVLTGIHLGQWGKDLDPRQDLDSLLEILSQGPLPFRVRLSSLEPMEWNHSLIDTIHRREWICPHFHIPLQSGDEDILREMRRPYTPRQYGELIATLHHLFPHAALGADVLAGFPGETEAQFANTYQLISRLPLTYLHAFPFSSRPGTPAASMPHRIPGGELKRRVSLLRALSHQKKLLFQRSLLGHCVEVLAETRIEEGWWRGTSENYLQVAFPASGPMPRGFIARVKLLELTEKGLVGKPVAIPLEK